MKKEGAYANIDKYIDRLITESTPDMPIWNIESIRQGKKPHWNYIDGCMITSLLQMNQIIGEDKYFNFAESFIDYYVKDDGSILGYDIEKYNLDDINEGRVLFELYRRTGKEKYRLAIEHQKKQLDAQPRTTTGNFWHKLIYPNQIWLDGIYMAQVFSALYAKEYGGKNYSIFLDRETLTLFGYIEIESEEKWSRSAETAICQKWWAYMADIMDTNPDNSPVSIDLVPVFHLD